jgi:hypothetical protein
VRVRVRIGVRVKVRKMSLQNVLRTTQNVHDTKARPKQEQINVHVLVEGLLG